MGVLSHGCSPDLALPSLGYGTISCELTSLLFVLDTAMKRMALANFVCVFNNFHPLVTLAIHLETRRALSNSTG